MISQNATPTELGAIANALRLADIDALPATGLGSPTDQPESGTLRLAGTLSGIPWNITSATDATTQLSVNTQGRMLSLLGGQHRDLTDTWDVNLAGLGDSGAIIFGPAPADITNIRIDVGSAFITLPVAHDDNGLAIYAMPVAPGLRIYEFELVTANGTVREHVQPPVFLVPASGGGGFTDQPLNGRFPTAP